MFLFKCDAILHDIRGFCAFQFHVLRCLSDVACLNKDAVILRQFLLQLVSQFCCYAGCLNRVTLGNVSLSFWKLY